MPNLASVLKAEVARLARKELRKSVEGLRKSAATHRSEIANLKRKIGDLEKQLKLLSKVATRTRGSRAAPVAPVDPAESAGLRFRAGGLASHRKRLGLSAHDFGLLVGASGQSVYLWEQGKAKPRPEFLAGIAALRKAGKKEVAARLAELKAGD
jgi:DNA-binding XRE family transcriptional regulator